MQLNNDNIEEYILLLSDNELDGQEEAAVRQYVAQHEAYKPMLDAYLAARLGADDELYVFPDKESLLKPEPVLLPLKRNISPLKIAASLVVLIGIGAALTLLLSRNTTNDSRHNTPLQVNKNSPVKTIVLIPATTADSSQWVAVIKPKANKTTVPSVQHKSGLVNNTQVMAVQTSRRNVPTVPVQLENTPLNKMELNLSDKAQAIAMVEKDEPVSQEHSKAIPKWLPVNEENLQGINSLIDHIQSLKEGIREKAQSLKNTALVITIGERQVSIGK